MTPNPGQLESESTKILKRMIIVGKDHPDYEKLKREFADLCDIEAQREAQRADRRDDEGASSNS